jgi:hypothetical protein
MRTSKKDEEEGIGLSCRLYCRRRLAQKSGRDSVYNQFHHKEIALSQTIYVSRKILEINSDYLPKRHWFP